MNNGFGAPWGTSVKILTPLSLGILGVVLYALSRLPLIWSGLGILMVVFPVVLVAGCAAYTIRGYRLKGRTLFIHRLWWDTRLDLSGLKAVEHNRRAMRWSLRLWGNGGFFLISGFFRNRTLGRYRAFVMDPKRAVVLTFLKRIVVVSPDPPDRFVSMVRETCGLHDGTGR